MQATFFIVDGNGNTLTSDAADTDLMGDGEAFARSGSFAEFSFERAVEFAHEHAADMPRDARIVDAKTGRTGFNYRANWDGAAYQVVFGDGDNGADPEWTSTDGDEWIDGSGRPVNTIEFRSSSICLIGGARDGEIVG
jgi:hypothetical protein